MRPVRVARDRWNFEMVGTGRFITPIGGNMLGTQHPIHGTLFDRFGKRDCDFRFGVMADLGLNCLRQAIGVNQVFDPKTGLKAAGMKSWDAFIGLAEKHGVYLMPVGGYLGGNDWFDAPRLADHGRALDESCAFWRAFAGHYAGHPAVWAWDLRNELLYDAAHCFEGRTRRNIARGEAMILDRWPAWLEARYGTVTTMNRVYRSRHKTFTEVPGYIKFVEKPFDLHANDCRHYLNERGYDWCKRQCDVIRAVSPNHMIVQGNNGWLCPDSDLWLANGFHNRALHDLFDFVTFHPYPAWQCVPGAHGDPLNGKEQMRFWINACIAKARMDFFGKPVVVQEFGWYGGGTGRFLNRLPYRSEQEHADYTRGLTDALIPHVNGFVNWPTMDMLNIDEISNHGGIFTHDGRRKKLAAVYESLVKRLIGKRQVRAQGTATLTFSLLGIHTSRPYQDRMWEELHRVIGDGAIPDIRFV